MDRIHADLIGRRQELMSSMRGWANVAGGLTICFIFLYFVYIQYETTQKEYEETKESHIPFTPVPWLSATRNVRMEEYGL